MSNRVYPRTVWVLMPSFKPMAVEVVSAYGVSYYDYGDVTAKGKRYAVAAMHETREQAIATGRYEIERLRADIAKRTETMNKRIAALDKAEGK
jgi:hypothetical protein